MQDQEEARPVGVRAMARRNVADTPLEMNEGGPQPALAGSEVENRSESELQCQLDLPGRTEVASRKARAQDSAKRAAGSRKNRVAEIRVIEKVKDFGPELKIKSLRNSGVLG
jgi:hypothetical protein